jgi:hypothetical protein
MADTIFYYSDNTTSSSSDSFIGANSRDLNKTLIGVDVGSVVGFMDDAFLNCTSLVNVSLGNTAINISNNCFRGCTNLTTINIPNTVQFLGASAFRNCFNLSNVRIGSGVFQIGYNCFQNCTALSNIIIPSNVTQILDSCFLGCSNLKKIYFNGNLPYFDGLLFLGTNVNLKLYRKKNFVTGWPNSFQGVPVVLWSDNTIKSGGTGKLIGKKRPTFIYALQSINQINNPSEIITEGLRFYITTQTLDIVLAFGLGTLTTNVYYDETNTYALWAIRAGHGAGYVWVITPIDRVGLYDIITGLGLGNKYYLRGSDNALGSYVGVGDWSGNGLTVASLP